MTLRASDLQSDSDLDSIHNSCDVLGTTEEEQKPDHNVKSCRCGTNYHFSVSIHN